MEWVGKHISLSNTDIMEYPKGYLAIFTACAAAYASYRLSAYCYYNYRVGQTKRLIWMRQEKRRQHVEVFRQALENEKGNFDPTIPNLKLTELQRRLQSGELTAREVVLAFQSKALQAQDELNCVTEFLDDAKTRAIQLDKLKPEDRGPLHGIPISLKETVVLAGRDATVGFTKCIGDTFKEDSVLVKLLIKQGAVPFVRTNIPQSLFSVECSNPIFGATKNPHNLARSPGGSSGGEGALIAYGASVLGIGCDMGGSNRVPAHFCGVSGFKCTPNRLSNAGNHPFGCFVKTIEEVYSPLGQNVDALVEFMKATLVPRQYELDPLLPRIPWNHDLYNDNKPLKIGFYTWDGGVEPVPAVKRAVLMAKSRLEARGHTVVEFHPPDVLYMFNRFFVGLLCADGGKGALKYMKYDVIDPCIKDLMDGFHMPAVIKRLLARFVPGLHQISRILIRPESPRDVSELWELNEEVEAYKRKFCDLMSSQGINCLICPVLPIPAFFLDKAAGNFTTLTYTTLYNVLAFPCGAVPITTVTPRDVEEMKDYHPANTDVHKFVHEISKGSEGLPIGVQCVGLPFEEETALRLMKELESSFSKQG